jgi:putative FmdB family regulatory protein
MSIYEYQCSHCNKRFDIRKPMSESSNISVCPFCSSTDTFRCWSVLILKDNSKTTEQKPNRKGGITLNNVTIENCGTAIRSENSEIRGNNVRLKGNKKGIVAKNSKLDIRGLSIE